MTAETPVATVVDRQAVAARLIATGILRLLSPAHFGGGEGDVTDAQLLRDAEGLPFIPGASLAGAGRSFLRRRGAPAEDLELLFGGKEGDRAGEGVQSALSIDDAFPTDDRPPPVALRDRVRLDPLRRAAADAGKFDEEVLEPGAQFALRLEVVLRGADTETQARLRRLCNALLDAFEAGEIRLGAHTRRGLGWVDVQAWRVFDLDFRRHVDVIRWLRDEAPDAAAPERCGTARVGDAIGSLDLPPYLLLTADLALDGPLLVRATPPGDQPNAPDAVQFRSGGLPVLPGSSLAGALRHRALRVCHTLAGDSPRAEQMVEGIFGPGFRGASPPGTLRASRLRLDESPIRDGRQQRQTRITIDRFTGGALSTALIEEAPLWSPTEAPAMLHLSVRLDAPRFDGQDISFDAECGLLLLLLRDLCTGDLTVGGEAGIGRGTLRGLAGAIERRDTTRRTWQWAAQGTTLQFSGQNPQSLDSWVQACTRYLEGDGDDRRAE